MMMAACFRLCSSCKSHLQGGVRAFTRQLLLSRALHSSQSLNSIKDQDVPKVNLWEEYQKVKDAADGEQTE
jgi:hypothetical protein